jgi:serine phosphatase RsbU (regulator of sigma subunit)
VEWLEALVGLPLGLGGAGQEQRRIVLDPGDVLVLYTDGLVERRGVSIDDGLGKLSTAASAAPAQAESLADSVIRELLRGAAPPDDVALLVCEAT